MLSIVNFFYYIFVSIFILLYIIILINQWTSPSPIARFKDTFFHSILNFPKPWSSTDRTKQMQYQHPGVCKNAPLYKPQLIFRRAQNAKLLIFDGKLSDWF